MDDRELETRLRKRLHERFDSASPSAQLTANVQEGLRAEPRTTRLLPEVRLGSRPFAWPVLGVAVVAVILAIAAIRLGSVIGPGDRSSAPPSGPSSTTLSVPDRQFIVLPASGAAPSREDSDLAVEVLTRRLETFGFDSITTAREQVIVFTVPGDGPADPAIRNVLEATGDVEFVPLPPEDYNDERFVAELGKPLPEDEPALFGWDGIASVRLDRSSEPAGSTAPPRLLVELKPAAQAALATWSEAHVGEVLAIVIDGRVAVLPRINEPIVRGDLVVAGGITNEGVEEAGAILVGGMLPERWQGATSPEILTRDEAIAIAVARFPNLSVAGSKLYVSMHDDQATPIWSVDLENTDPSLCEGLVADDAAGCLNFATEVRIVATTGETLTLQDWDDAAEPSALP